MDPLFENILIGLGTGLVTGLLSGYYSGLVVSRTARFSALLRDAERPFKTVEYMQEAGFVQVAGWNENPLDRAADDLAADKQVKASLAVRAQVAEMRETLQKAGRGEIDADEFERSLKASRAVIRRLRPHPRVLMPWGSP
ncbi:hypothetical protein MOQ18_12635 [Stenotrophomonas maltophilia]|uniref:hypothetical protein n=1 Tax=Stenotrophomonas maltophilia TaxID=40324 RepID=UPI001F53A7E1|nr:hypothetical protein [Stenotrophomonas maltophilia]MCI1157007.1 hypothetical protein [Stenotrophomonas maltophilia]